MEWCVDDTCIACQHFYFFRYYISIYIITNIKPIVEKYRNLFFCTIPKQRRPLNKRNRKKPAPAETENKKTADTNAGNNCQTQKKNAEKEIIIEQQIPRGIANEKQKKTKNCGGQLRRHQATIKTSLDRHLTNKLSDIWSRVYSSCLAYRKRNTSATHRSV